MSVLRSRDNARVRRWRRLMEEARARRAEGSALLEGVHLVSAYLATGGLPKALIVSEAAAAAREIASLLRGCPIEPTLVSERVFAAISDTEAPVGIAAEIAIPQAKPQLAECACCVFLDAIQDAGNLGTLLRSAAAFDVRDAVLGRGCADPWSPKALRAGMGAQLAMRIAASRDLAAELERFDGVVACTVPRGGTALTQAELGGRIAWLFGTEGRGVSPELQARAQLKVTIPMAGAAESLNVAAAAAICFYERARRFSTPGARS